MKIGIPPTIKRIARLTVITVAGLILFPFFQFSRRPPEEVFRPTKSWTFRLSDAELAQLVKGTQTGLVSEGPCQSGCKGGVLNDNPLHKGGKFIPVLPKINSKTRMILWTYQIKPRKVVRHNDLWGDDQAKIHGTWTGNRRTYFTIVPRRILKDPLVWLFFEKEQPGQ